MNLSSVLYGLGMYALGVLTDNLVWRYRRRIERADAQADAAATARSEAAVPLLAVLDRIESTLRLFGPECGPRMHASILTEEGTALDQALLALRPHLSAPDFAALEPAVQDCTADQAKADSQHCQKCLDRVRALISQLAHA